MSKDVHCKLKPYEEHKIPHLPNFLDIPKLPPSNKQNKSSQQKRKAEIKRKNDENERQIIKIIADLKHAQRRISRTVFRGLYNDEYDLIPTIGRPKDIEDKDSYNAEKAEKILLRIMKSEGVMFLKDRGNLSDIDLLALAQHFGAPTRLLDWTTNPLVALYFAVFKEGSIANNTDGIIYVYKSEVSDHIREQIELNTNEDNQEPLFKIENFEAKDGISNRNVKFIFPRFVDERIKNQSGLFSLQRNLKLSFAAKENCDPNRIWYVLIPKEIKAALARFLYGVGIRRDFIMPGFEGFCETLSYRYNNNVNIPAISLEKRDEERGIPDVEEGDSHEALASN
jgi:FRG domain-containing protein